MKKILSYIGIAGIVTLFSCGGAETKVDTKDSVTITDTAQRVSDEKVPVTPATPEPRNGKADVKVKVTNEKNEILANIDRHLVTVIQGNSLTVENTLADASFQRMIVEVSEVSEAGVAQKTDFYTVINLEPGEKKSVKLNTVSAGAKLETHIVKAKSTQLTNGEMILVGSRYSPQ